MNELTHVNVNFTDREDDAQLEVRYLSGAVYDLVVDRTHLTWFGDDAKQRLLDVLARLTAEVEALP